MVDARTTVIRAVAVVATVISVGMLAWMLRLPGDGPSRVGLFAAIASFAISAGLGAITTRWRVMTGAGIGLFLLGFWQAAIWIVVQPVAFVHNVGGLLLHDVEVG